MEQPITYKTLRDEIAMLALQCLFAANRQDLPYPEGYATEAYKVADQMLKAREAE